MLTRALSHHLMSFMCVVLFYPCVYSLYILPSFSYSFSDERNDLGPRIHKTFLTDFSYLDLSCTANVLLKRFCEYRPYIVSYTLQAYCLLKLDEWISFSPYHCYKVVFSSFITGHIIVNHAITWLVSFIPKGATSKPRK